MSSPAQGRGGWARRYLIGRQRGRRYHRSALALRLHCREQLV
jgi:hypothetical protein